MIKKIIYFVLIFISVLVLLATIYNLLFKGTVDKNQLGFDNFFECLTVVTSIPLGNINMYNKNDAVDLFKNKSNFFWPE